MPRKNGKPTGHEKNNARCKVFAMTFCDIAVDGGKRWSDLTREDVEQLMHKTLFASGMVIRLNPKAQRYLTANKPRA